MTNDAEVRAQFSKWLSAQLETRGLSHQAFADMVGPARSNVRNWVYGGNLPSWHNCREIASALGYPKEEVRRLAGFVDPEDEPPIVEDEGILELIALARAADEEDRRMLLRIARLQSGHPRRASRGQR